MKNSQQEDKEEEIALYCNIYLSKIMGIIFQNNKIKEKPLCHRDLWQSPKNNRKVRDVYGDTGHFYGYCHI